MFWGTASFKNIEGKYHSDVMSFNSKTAAYVSKWIIEKSEDNKWLLTKFSNLNQAYQYVSKHETLAAAKQAVTDIEHENVRLTEEEIGEGQITERAVAAIETAAAVKAAKVEKKIAKENPVKAPRKSTVKSEVKSEAAMDAAFKAACKKASAEVMNRKTPSSRLVLLEAGGSGATVTYVYFRVGAKEYSARRDNESASWSTEITAVTEA